MVTETKEAIKAEPIISEAEEIGAEIGAETGLEPEKEEGLKFKTQAEQDAHIQKEVRRQADSIANKSLVTYQQQVDDLKRQIKEAERRVSEKQEDDAFTRLENAQKEDWGETPEVGDFQEAQKMLLGKVRQFNKEKDEWADKLNKLTHNAKEQLAFTKALELYLVPEDAEEFLSSVKSFAKKLAGAETDREMELLYSLEEEKLNRLAGAKEERTPPDSGFPSAPGGVDLTKLSARELLVRGFKKELNK